MKQTKIIAAFPGTGKTFLYNNPPTTYTILDSDSSHYSWVTDENGVNTKERNPDFPANYIQHIKDNVGLVDIIFVSSHDVVRNALYAANLSFHLVYPDHSLKNDYVQRYIDRGSPEGFVRLVEANWDVWMNDLETQKGCTHIVLQPDEYISNILNTIV